jgi:hypothetical protein
MFRNRVRPPTPPLDEVTAERLLDGAPVEELPAAYRQLGALLARAAGPASAEELAGSATAAAEFVAAHHAATTPQHRVRSLVTSVVVTLTLVTSTGTAVAAVQGALPDPIQQVAHDALGVVGIAVPGIARRTEPGPRDGADSTPPVTVSDSDTQSPSTPSTLSTTPSGAGGAVVPAMTPAAPGEQPAVGDPSAPPVQHEANPNAGAPGNDEGEGNPNPGDGNQGVGGGDQTPPGGGQPSAPGSDLPPQSNGRGNGPPQVPPGQDKKIGP